jgi:hypothetical protein
MEEIRPIRNGAPPAADKINCGKIVPEQLFSHTRGHFGGVDRAQNRVVEFLLGGRLDQQTYEEQVQRLKLEIQGAKDQFAEADME